MVVCIAINIVFLTIKMFFFSFFCNMDCSGFPSKAATETCIAEISVRREVPNVEQTDHPPGKKVSVRREELSPGKMLFV